jgi:hypothetical protein
MVYIISCRSCHGWWADSSLSHCTECGSGHIRYTNTLSPFTWETTVKPDPHAELAAIRQDIMKDVYVTLPINKHIDSWTSADWDWFGQLYRARQMMQEYDQRVAYDTSGKPNDVDGLRADILYLAQVAATSNDRKALIRLQTSLTRWIHANMSKEQDA